MEKFELAVAAFTHENSRDPNQVVDQGVSKPREVVDAERLAAWVDRLAPSASEALRLAARCQHICRFEIARRAYPEGRVGYLEWRKALSRFHADKAEGILRGLDYDEQVIQRVRAINQKRALKQDPEVQTMEDALCLVFLEFELSDFVARHAEEKVVDVLQKTWGKMSEQGHAAALALSLPPPLSALVEKALSRGEGPAGRDQR
jgi:hypothetical protein